MKIIHNVRESKLRALNMNNRTLCPIQEQRERQYFGSKTYSHISNIICAATIHPICIHYGIQSPVYISLS